MRNGVCYQQPTLELHTSANGSGFLPTPTTIDTGSRWPTPTVKGNYNRKGLSSKSGDGLATAVIQRERAERAPDNLISQVRATDGSGRLNPEWVEWLMGWPIGWTALQPLEMARFREWQQQHSYCSRAD